jgi:hypothetical protein
MIMKNKFVVMFAVISFTGLLLTSCYKEFDPSTYQPAFEINGYSSIKQIQPGKLVSYWAFDQSLIDSVSSAAATNDGSAFTGGFIGKGLDLNVDNKSNITFVPSSTIKNLHSFTISFWVKPTFVDKDGDGGIDGILGLFNVANNSDFWGYLDWFVENGSNPTSATLKIHFKGTGSADTWVVKSGVSGFFGTWSNHTLTYDATTSMVTYYMNGSVLVPATTTPWTGNLDWSGIGTIVMGCVQFQANPSLGTAGGTQGWASWLTGNMDEVRVYSTALTATEVNALVVLQGKAGK